jgi:hypothetical protein
VGGGWAPPGYYSIHLLTRTHEHFKVTSFLINNGWEYFLLNRRFPFGCCMRYRTTVYFVPGFSVKVLLKFIKNIQVIPFWLLYALPNYSLFRPRFFCQKSSNNISNIQVIPFWLLYALPNFGLFLPRFFCQKSY